MKKLKKKEWTPKQMERLPKPGYWVSRYKDMEEVSVYCVMNGYVKYIHYLCGRDWNTLLWTCMPTAKQITESMDGFSFEYFGTYGEMKSKYPTHILSKLGKAPNDF